MGRDGSSFFSWLLHNGVFNSYDYICMVFLKTKKKDAVVPCVICGVFVLLSICVSICAFTHLPETRYQTRYVVTISDDVNFNELNSRYEVVKQEGLIYTIVEKTDEE